jgi:hypothetical protein
MVAGALLLTGLVSADWSQLGGDAGHTYRQPHETLIGVDTVASLARVWRVEVVPARLQGIAGLAISDGVIYVAAFGRVRADDTPTTRLYAGSLRGSTSRAGRGDPWNVDA